MNIVIDIENVSTVGAIPNNESIRAWASAALGHPNVKKSVENSTEKSTENSEVSIRIVDAPEIQALNAEYRHQDKPTNVLSFPAEFPAELNIPLLGDLVICASIVKQEAIDQQKTAEAHWAHMVVHGVLHLLGYDHVNETDAETMEALETQLVISFGFAKPYALDE